MTTTADPQSAPEAPRPGSAALVGLHPWRRLSLYARVLIVNTLVLVAAVLVLVVSPATVSFPVAAEQGTVLALGVVAMAASNAVLLRVNFRGLTSVVRQMRTLDVLQAPERLAETGGRDARTLIAGFNHMVDRLEAERRSSTRRALHALESERRRIGRELHDEVGQRLTGSLLQLGRLADEVPEPWRAVVLELQEQQRATLDEVGSMAWQLRPALLDDLGLVEALGALSGSLRDGGGPTVVVSVPESVPGLSPEEELVVYRIAQEAVTNAVRHSGATVVRLGLATGSASLVLDVVDDGSGLSAEAQAGPGIRGMRERALLVGGRLTVSSAQPHGVRVRLALPRPPQGRS